MAINASRVYRIRSHDREFVTASLADGIQVLLVPLTSTSVARVLFDTVGSLLSAKEVAGTLNDEQNVLSTRDVSDRLAMRPESIAVLEFSVPSCGVAIRPRPEVFDEFMANPEALEPNERYRERTYSQVREWDRENRFVLTTWGKEYWMNADGSVFAT